MRFFFEVIEKTRQFPVLIFLKKFYYFEINVCSMSQQCRTIYEIDCSSRDVKICQIFVQFSAIISSIHSTNEKVLENPTGRPKSHPRALTKLLTRFNEGVPFS